MSHQGNYHENEQSHRVPTHGAIPLHGPLSDAERREAERERRDEEYRRQDASYKDRQTAIAEKQAVIANKQLRANSWLTGFTLLLVITSFIGNYIALESAGAAKSAAEIASNTLLDTQKSRAIADITHTQEFNTTDRHTIDAINSTRDMSRMDQRAWIGVQGMSLVEPKPNEPIGVYVRFVNTGKTPGLRVTSNVTIVPVFRTLNIAHYAVSKDRPRVEESRPLAAFPGIPFGGGPYTANGKATQSGIGLLMSGKAYLYVFGEVSYRDIFGIPHWTHYCGEWNSSTKAFSACRDYNDAE